MSQPLLNFALFAVAMLGAVSGVWALVRGFRGDQPRRSKRTLRRCPRCWYSMASVPGCTCPECGTATSDDRDFYRSRRSRRAIAVGLALIVLGTSSFVWMRIRGGSVWSIVPVTAVIVALPWYDQAPVSIRSGMDRRLGESAASLRDWQRRWAARRGAALATAGSTPALPYVLPKIIMESSHDAGVPADRFVQAMLNLSFRGTLMLRQQEHKYPPGELIPPLIEAMRDPWKRYDADQLLRQLRPDSEAPLRGQLRIGTPELRALAAAALAERSRPEADLLPHLVAGLDCGQDHIALLCAQLIEDYGPSAAAAAPALQRAAGSPNRSVAGAASKALSAVTKAPAPLQPDAASR